MKIFLSFAFVLICGLSLLAQSGGSQPSFSAVAMDGQKIETSALLGKVVVINLWYINCPNCVEEIKLLNHLVDEYKDNKDVLFVGLAASTKPSLVKFLKKYPFKYQVVPGADTIIISKFGTPDKNGNIEIPFPMHYVLDREGKVIVKVQGIKGIESVKRELRKQFPVKAAGGK